MTRTTSMGVRLGAEPGDHEDDLLHTRKEEKSILIDVGDRIAVRFMGVARATALS